MGMYDTIEVLDDARELCCPQGHALRSFQTKDLDDPSMSTYLVHEGKLYLASTREDRASDHDDADQWHVREGEAVHEHRYVLREILGPRTVRAYSSCRSCTPVLVRTSGVGVFGDFVGEHALFVDFALTFRRGEPMQVERISGTREDLAKELRESGHYVLSDDHPLAMAHREIQKAHAERGTSGRRWRGR